MKNALAILFLLLSFSECSEGQVAHYVKNGGDDSFDGLSDATAWATLTKVNNHAFLPGDSILLRRGDKWESPQKLVVNSSGDAKHHIYYGAYGTGAKPIINGNKSLTGWNISTNWTETSSGSNIWSTSLLTYDYSRIFLSGKEAHRNQTSNVTSILNYYYGNSKLYIYCSGNPATTLTGNGVEYAHNQINISAASANADYISIMYLDVRGGQVGISMSGVSDWIVDSCMVGAYCTTNAIKAEAQGTTRTSTNNIIIRNCIFDDYDHHVDLFLLNNAYEGLSIYKGCNNWDIYNNVFKGWTHGAFILKQYIANRPCINIKFHDNVCSGSGIDYGRGFLVHLFTDPGASYGNEMYNNYFLDYGSWNEFSGTGDNFKFYNNVIDGVRRTNWLPSEDGVSLQGFTGNTINFEIFNNIFMNCEGNGLSIIFSTSFTTQSVSVKNNIFYNNASYGLRIMQSPGWILQNTFQNNLFYKAGTSDVIYDDKYSDNVKTVEEFNNLNLSYTGIRSGNVPDIISGNKAGDPLFVDADNIDFHKRDYHLKEGSPALGAGINVGLITDLSGFAWLSPPNIGVFSTGSNVVNPIYVKSVVENDNPNILEITFDLSLDNVLPSTSAFKVSVNSENIPVIGISIFGEKLRLVLQKAVIIGDYVTLTYIKPTDMPLQAGAGLVASFINKVVNNNVGSKSIPSELAIKIYPNPARNLLNLFFEEPSYVPYSIRIVSLSGKLLFEGLLETGRQNVEVPINLIEGIYVIQILSGKFIMNAQSFVVVK